MSGRDLYRILGVDEKADAEEIKKAYRRLARRYHPDKTKGDKRAEERFKEVNDAYLVLKDEKKRRQYDASRRGGGNPFAAFGAGAQGGPGNFAEEGGLGGIGGIFESLFGGGRRPQGAPFNVPRAGQDVTTTLTIPFELAVRGGKQKINVTVNEPDESGKPRPESREVSVKIPPGIKDGQKIRLSGAGEPGRDGGPAGSLMITVKVQPHLIFTRQDDDIYSTSRIDLPTAMLGGSTKVRTLDKVITLKIPPGTQPGKRFKLSGLGGARRDGTRGDHYAVIEVRLPEKLTPGQKALFEEFAESLRNE